MKEFPFDPYDFFGYLAAGFVVLFGLELTLGVPSFIGKELHALDMTLLTIAAYVAGQLVATPSKAILESLVANKLLGSPSCNLMSRKETRSKLSLLFPGYFSPLPSVIQDRIIERSTSEGLAVAKGESLFLHIRFREYIRTDEVLMSRVNSFLNKYGFNRNLAFVSLLFSVVILLSTPFDIHSDTTRYAAISGVTSILLFYRYLKFYRQYAYELLNSYAGKS